MQFWPKHGHTSFKAVIYNQEVRALVKENRSHADFEDHWADPRAHGVEARNEREALDAIFERYPPEAGFVIQTLVPLRKH